MSKELDMERKEKELEDRLQRLQQLEEDIKAKEKQLIEEGRKAQA